MKLFLSIFTLLFLVLAPAQTGKIQGQDSKTVAELISAGGTAADLLKDTQVYVTADGLNKTLFSALTDNDIGTVNSVAMSVPSILSVAGSPITSSGTLAVTLQTQSANLCFAGPTGGGPATPTFRSLVAADIPLISLTTGVSGVLPIANGGTNISTYTTGDILYSSATDVLSRLPAGTNGHVLTLAAGVPSWAASAGGGSGNFALTSVDLVATNPTLSGEQTLDGVLTSTSRVLVTYSGADYQSTANGCYVTAAGAWVRCADMDSSAEFYSGMKIHVLSGTLWKYSTWFLGTANPITLGASGLKFYQENVAFGSAGVTTGGFRITNSVENYGTTNPKQIIFRVEDSAAQGALTIKTSVNQPTGTLQIPLVSTTTDEILTKEAAAIGIVGKRFDTTAANPNRAFSWYYPDPELFGAGFGGDPGLDGGWNAIFFNAFYPRFRKGSNQGTNYFEQRHLAVATVATSNITLSGEQTINGVTTSVSRVLVVGQTTASQNGIYVTRPGAWFRPGAGGVSGDAANENADGDLSNDFYPGLKIYVNGGTYVNSEWTLTTALPITLGSTSLSFTQSSGFLNTTAALSVDTVTVSADTYVDVTGASVALTAGVWDICFEGSLSYAAVLVGTIEGNLAITDSSNVVQGNSLPYAKKILATLGTNVVDPVMFCAREISVPSTATYKLRVRNADVDTNSTITVLGAASQTGGLTNPDVKSVLYARRVQ